MTDNEMYQQQRICNERAERLEAYRKRVESLEAELAEARQWKEKWETCEKWRKAYQEAKGELFAMGGEIAEASIQHLPCNEAAVDRWFRSEYVHKSAFNSVTAELAEARKDGERLALVQAAADRYFEAYTTAERERVALVKRSHNQRLEIARLQALRGTR